MDKLKNQAALLFLLFTVFFSGCIQDNIVSVDQSAALSSSSPQVTISVGNEAMPISDKLFGIFFEDINYAADGGLYPELIQNRSFEYTRADNRDWNPLSCWTLLQTEKDSAAVAVETDEPLNQNNPSYAVLTLNKNGSRNGLANSGFDGIVLNKGDKYDISLFARKINGNPGPIFVRIENSRGQTLTQVKFDNLTGRWKKYKATVTAKQSQTHAGFAVVAEGTGQIALDMISLFPRKTFKNRPNGLHPGLAEIIADLKPKFVRFPGGCLAHGDGLENMYRWKDTIGPVEQRKAQRNIWRYHQTLGLGYFEYFQFCEDIGAEPLPVVPAGVCCQNSGNYLNLVPRGQQGLPMDEMADYIQEVLDLIEWANGPTDSEWGSKRAAAGHPEPFNLKYLGLGNEDEITDTFKERYKMINDAVKVMYPEIIIIGTTGPFTDGRDYDLGWEFARQQRLEMVDEHGYKSPAWFWKNLERFDKYDRNGTLVYLGEYAAHDTDRINTLRSALAEAAYMTALERNGDLVVLSSYAPLLSKQGRTQWRPDMIYFDNTTITASVNYYVQQLFSINYGDSYLPTKIEITAPDKTAQEPSVIQNGVILGSWDTNVVYDDLKVVNGNETVINETFDNCDDRTGNISGIWLCQDGVFSQTSYDKPAISRLPFDDNKQGYTMTVKAMKKSGSEGFLIGFSACDDRNYCWLNLGGWGNVEHRLQRTSDGSTDSFGPAAKGRIESDRWYDVKIEVKGKHITCYLDGDKIIETDRPDYAETPDIAASAVCDPDTSDVIVKIISKSETAIAGQIDLTALGSFEPKAAKTVLTGDPMSSNEFGQAPAVLPIESEIEVSGKFNYVIPPYSMTVLRLKPIE